MIYADVTIFASSAFLVFILAWGAEILEELWDDWRQHDNQIG